MINKMDFVKNKKGSVITEHLPEIMILLLLAMILIYMFFLKPDPIIKDLIGKFTSSIFSQN